MRRISGDHKPLTIRETQVLALIALGESSKQIAWKLGISQSAVRKHAEQILRHYDAPNRTAAVVSALRLGDIKLAEEARGASSAFSENRRPLESGLRNQVSNT